MGIQLIGNGGTIVGAGEEAALPAHTARFPLAGNWYRYSGHTGTIGAALAADSEVLQFRFLSGVKSFALVYKIALEGIGIVAVATAGGPMGFNLIPARAWTAAGSGGTRISVAGDNLQTETALANSQVNDLGIATTGALTAGTKTLDANAQGGILWSQGTGAVTTYQQIVQGVQNIYDADGEGQQPLVLANQEGFVIRTSHVGVAALTYVARFRVVWAEVTAF
jgi:hypothetical protein